MSNEADPNFWQWMGENFWLPLLALVLSLISVIRFGDLKRISDVEAILATKASKEDLNRVEILAAKAVQVERFEEYINNIERSRIESRDQINAQFSDIKKQLENVTDRLSALTERVVARGYAVDERTHPRGQETKR